MGSGNAVGKAEGGIQSPPIQDLHTKAACPPPLAPSHIYRVGKSYRPGILIRLISTELNSRPAPRPPSQSPLTQPRLNSPQLPLFTPQQQQSREDEGGARGTNGKKE